MHVAHIITGLATGGAETMLLKLVRGGQRGVRHSVVSLRTSGTVGPQLERLGATVISLNLQAGRIPGFSAWTLVEHVRRLKADLLQGWMYHGNLAAWFGYASLSDRPALCWSVRCSLGNIATESLLTRSVIRACRALSRTPASIIYNSDRSRGEHEGFGFAAANGVVIPNGFDTSQFHADIPRRVRARERLNVAPDQVVVGLVARLHAVKDHLSFFRACNYAASRCPRAVFVAVGRDVTRAAALRPELQPFIQNLGDNLRLIDDYSDVPSLMNALDIAVLCSIAEGFPNVIGEAMASEVPCVVTDVGDCAAIVGDAGIVVPPRAPERLGAAIVDLVATPSEVRTLLGRKARARIVTNYSLSSSVGKYEGEWSRVLTDSADHHSGNRGA